MQDNTGKVVLGLLGMVALWIAVYWWWPVDPPVSFAQSQSAAPPVFGTSDRPPPTLAQQPIDQIATPPVLVPPVPQGPGVIAPVFLQHTIGVGETLESISKMYYGSTDHTAAILAANPTKNPPDLKPGRIINVPKDPRNIQGIPVAAPPSADSDIPVTNAPTASEYVVQQGDALSKISQKVYGSSRHANIIYEANRDAMKNPNSLRVGQKLRIPPKPADKSNAGGGGN